MSSTFDLLASIGTGSNDDDKKSPSKTIASAQVETGLFKGVPSRVLTIVFKDDEKKGDLRVYLTADKKLRAIQLKINQGETPIVVTEAVKVMETIPAPDKTLFTFTPPAGAVKVEKFDE